MKLEMADMKKKRQSNFSDKELMTMITVVSEKQGTLFAMKLIYF